MKVVGIGVVLIAALLVSAGCRRGVAKQTGTKGVASDTLIDAAGRVVKLPPRVSRVVSPFTMYTRLIAAMGGCDRLVGISHSCLLPEEMRGCGGILEDLPDVGQFGDNIELIASLQPDIIFASHQDVATFSSKTNAAVVSISFPHEMPMLEMFNRQIDLIGNALGLQENGDSLKQFIRGLLMPVLSVTAGIHENEKPKVYFAWTSWTGDILNTVCEFDPIELAGGVNVAQEANNFAKGQRGILVSREHILKWNPDVIFISRYQEQKGRSTGPAKTFPVSVNAVLDDPLMQSVHAVKHRRVYYTTAFCNWWPQQRALAQVLQMAKLFHPHKFRDLDVEREGNRIFKRFCGVDSLYSEMADDLELDLGK